MKFFQDKEWVYFQANAERRGLYLLQQYDSVIIQLGQ
jgi:hypothetical protein